jgi:hypothetical protein
MNRTLAAAVMAFGLTMSFAWAASAAAPHGHEGHGLPAIEMKLNNGQKWQTDEALRTGMSRIRDALEVSLPLIHSGQFSPAEFTALANRVQENVDYVVANCELPAEADLELHVALTLLLDGISTMKGQRDQEQGAVAIMQALNAYGDHFDHPGWMSLGH